MRLGGMQAARLDVVGTVLDLRKGRELGDECWGKRT